MVDRPTLTMRTIAVAAFAVLLAMAGLVVICLLRSPLRFAGAGLVMLGVIAVLNTERPDVLVSAAGDIAAVRSLDGRLTAVKFGSDTLSVREWLAADGDERIPADRSVAAGFGCDADGCVARLRDGTAVTVSRTAGALAVDCARAALVVTTRFPPPDCNATVVDRPALRRGDATALRHANGTFAQTSARPDGYNRPWATRHAGSSGRRHPPTTATRRRHPRPISIRSLRN